MPARARSLRSPKRSAAHAVKGDTRVLHDEMMKAEGGFHFERCASTNDSRGFGVNAPMISETR